MESSHGQEALNYQVRGIRALWQQQTLVCCSKSVKPHHDISFRHLYQLVTQTRAMVPYAQYILSTSLEVNLCPS